MGVTVDSLKDELYGFSSTSLKEGMLGYLCRPGLASHHAYTYMHTQYSLAVSAPQGQLVRVIDRRLKPLSGGGGLLNFVYRRTGGLHDPSGQTARELCLHGTHSE